MADSKFAVLDDIASGTFGDVKRAQDKETGEIVAIKVCKPHLHDLKDSGVPTSLLREISILKELRHPNIVELKT